MAITIPHPETGEPVELFVRINEDGYVDALCRAAYKSAWEQAALANGLLRQDVIGTDNDEPILGDPYPVEGVFIDVIGPVTVTPAVIDENGAEITPADIDNRYHVNLRLSPEVNWFPIAYAWMTNGNDDAEPNKDEETRTLARVSLIDPDSIKTPTRVWF